MPAPASSTNDSAICVTAKTRRRRFVPGVMRSRRSPARVRSARMRRRAAAGRTRAPRRRPSPGRRRPTAGSRPPSRRARAPRSARRSGRRRVTSGPRQQHAEHRAGAAEHEALGEQRPAQRAGARAERRAHGQLAFAPHRARQDQVGDVRAGDRRRPAPRPRAARAGSSAPAR